MKLLCVLVVCDWLIHNPIALFYNLIALRYTSLSLPHLLHKLSRYLPGWRIFPWLSRRA